MNSELINICKTKLKNTENEVKKVLDDMAAEESVSDIEPF